MGTPPGGVGKLEERQEVLLEMIDSFSSVFKHPTSALLHEYILLCRLQADVLHQLRDYDFHAYMRGPFSEQLRADIQVLADQGLIEVKDGRLTIAGKGTVLIKKLRRRSTFSGIQAASAQILQNYGSPHAISEALRPYLDEAELGKVLELT